MLINRKINIIKYLNTNQFNLASQPSILRAYTLQNNNWLKYDKFNNDFGLPQDFESLQQNKYYIIFTETNASFNLDVGDYSLIQEENIISTKQLAIYKGSIVNAYSKSQISKLYYLSENNTWNNSWASWSRSDYELGAGDSYLLENSKFYLLMSSNVPYVFWNSSTPNPTPTATPNPTTTPMPTSSLNVYNRSASLINSHKNWGLLRHAISVNLNEWGK